jgi:hypothetical protein
MESGSALPMERGRRGTSYPILIAGRILFVAASVMGNLQSSLVTLSSIMTRQRPSGEKCIDSELNCFFCCQSTRWEPQMSPAGDDGNSKTRSGPGPLPD